MLRDLTSSPSQSVDSHLASLAEDAGNADGTGDYSAGAELRFGDRTRLCRLVKAQVLSCPLGQDDI